MPIILTPKPDSLENKIQRIKLCFRSDGIPALKTDRFTQDQYDEMCAKAKLQFKNGTYVRSEHLKKGAKIWNDEEIGAQINTALNQIEWKEYELNARAHDVFRSLKFEADSKEEDLRIYKAAIYKMVGWDTLTPLDNNFWATLGNVAGVIREDNRNPVLVEAMKLYGACGTQTVFGTGEKMTIAWKYSHAYVFNRAEKEWDKIYALKKESRICYNSMYENLDDLEENVTVKRMPVEAKNFYRDKTKNLSQRIKVFSKHGNHESYIWQPDDYDLNKIFEIMTEDCEERRMTIDTVEMIGEWIWHLKDKRSKIDYSENPQHPRLKTTNRGYVPSEEAATRLKKYYLEKLFVAGIGSFDFDW